MKSKAKLYVIGALVGALAVSPAHATIIGTGDVAPPALLGVNPGNVDITGSSAIVNNGSLTVNGGSSLTADAILGSLSSQTAISNFEFTGNGTTVNLVGTSDPLAMGISGHSNLTVSAGAVVNATNSNVNVFGQRAGSSADITFTGQNTQVNFQNNQTVLVGGGLKGVSTTPDAATTVNFDILDGAVFNSGRAAIAPQLIPGDPNEARPNNITSTVNVSGQGSAWKTTSGSFVVGQGLNNTGKLNISNGGNVDVTADNAFMSVGLSGGTGNVTVDGPNSSITLNGGPLNQQAAFLTIGRSGTGTLDLTNGGKVVIDGLAGGNSPGFQIGRDFGGDGTINITGPNSAIEVKGARRGFATIGRNNNSIGRLNITEGGKVQQNAGALNFVGRNTGSTGEVLVSGAGSEYNGGQLIGIGLQSNQITSGGKGTVTVADSGLVTAEEIRLGADGRLIVESNGQVVTGSLTAGQDAPGLTTPGVSTVNITGAGSKVAATNLGVGIVTIGANTDAALNITDGGSMEGFRVLNTAQNGATANMKVDGANSRLSLTAGLTNDQDAFLSIGRNGTSTLDVTNGGQVIIDGRTTELPGFQAGRESGSNGTINVAGAGSKIEIQGDNAGLVNIGRNAGATGALNVTGGGKVLLNTGAASLIGREIGSTGSVLVSGTGSEYDGGRFIGVGMQFDELSSGGDGTLTVSDNGLVKTELLRLGVNGKLNVNSGGQVIASVGVDSSIDFIPVPATGVSTISVSGPGSKISAANPGNGFLFFGSSSDTDVSITNGGSMEGFRFLNLAAGGNQGNMTIDGPDSTLKLSGGPVGGGQGAFMTIGRAGTGVLDITNGGQVIIDGGADGDFPGFQLGRDENSGASGTINVTGVGSKIEVKGDNRGFVSIGRENTTSGTLNITDGGTVALNSGGRTFIGRNAGATGRVLISGEGSLYDGNDFIGIGLQSDRVTSGGDGVLTVENNGVVKANTIGIGANGVLKGSGGVVNANVVAFDGGMVAPGSSPGDMGILGGLDLRNGGVLQIEIGGINLGEFDRLFVGGDVLVDGTTSIVFSFIDGAATDPDLLITDFIDIDAFFFDIDPLNFDIDDPTANATAFDPALWTPAQFSAVGQGFDREVFVDARGQFSFTNGVPVAEPGTLALFAIGLAGIGAMRRRQKLSA